MQLAGRMSAAIEVLTDIEIRRRPASDALRDWGLAHRFAGAGDRAAIGNLVYDALRRRASHAWSMGEDAPRALVLSVAVRDWGQDVEALAAGFSTDRFAPEALTPEETGRLRADDPLHDAPGHVRADVPEWLVEAFERSVGTQWVEEGRALAARPPLDMRVNLLKSTRERVLKSLARFTPEPTRLSPLGVRIPAGASGARTPNVQTDEGYLKGWFEIQDEGSQIVSLLAGAGAADQILDFCAGAGGKTLALAAAMGNRGQIFAHDADRARLAPIYDRLKRAGVRNAQVRPPSPGGLDDLVAKMDRVLVDAPCTGTGTWRRRPDSKWRLSPDQLQARCAEQAAILDDASAFVRPGGELAYITCSLLPQENQDQVAAFCARHPGFQPAPMPELWQARMQQVAAPPGLAQDGLLLSPHTTGTDGFFVSVLARLR